ncbi:hypothetical protein CDL12_12011 [Handroanthus impetiginosus]|uniref:WEB family protein n=1 Tax=Handroanthus impetiginosus TaxID=429701 RepID=A0A2G9HDI2_9LAMI|nr:hypothetical protein CDL12_12011 [Handroanthus impetiginosus]
MENGGMTKMSKAEIDTSAPFQSVKEAVTLFGETVVAGELYANNPRTEGTRRKHNEETATLMSELEEAKQNLRKAQERSIQMTQCLSSLQQELEQAKRELHHFKTRHVLSDLEIQEDLKYVESSSELIEQVNKNIFANKRSMSTARVVVPPSLVNKDTFANNRSMSMARVVVPPSSKAAEEAVLQRNASLKKKKKKKQLIPFIAGIFGKKKGSSEIGLA